MNLKEKNSLLKCTVFLIRRDIFSGVTLLSRDVFEAQQGKSKSTLLCKTKT